MDIDSQSVDSTAIPEQIYGVSVHQFYNRWDTVTWYWTTDVCDAGVSGTAILPGDMSDAYEVNTFITCR